MVIRYGEGLTRDELRYILQPKYVHSPDSPGETFCVLKEKERKCITANTLPAAWFWRHGINLKGFTNWIIKAER
jgi:hypothetical protein